MLITQDFSFGKVKWLFISIAKDHIDPDRALEAQAFGVLDPLDPGIIEL